MPGMAPVLRLAKHKMLDGDKPLAVSVIEAAARIRVGRNTMHRLIAEKKIRAVRIGRMIRIPVAALNEYLAKLEPLCADCHTSAERAEQGRARDLQEGRI